MAVVTKDGHVTWIPTAIFRSTCSIDILYFPFDIQVKTYTIINRLIINTVTLTSLT